MEHLILGARSELARHLKLDPRNAILSRFKPVAYMQAGGTRTALYSIDANLSPYKLADFQRVERAKGPQKLALTRDLSRHYGEGWTEQIKSLMY